MTTTAPVAGWYPDPLDSGGNRYWDGTAWTEQTSPAAPPAPVAAATSPQIPEQVPYAVSSPSTYAAPGTGPYAVPNAMRAGAVRQQSLYPVRRSGPSTGVKVLIGIAVVFGVIMLIGILASIAIPVFLNQRAKGQEQSSPSTTSGPVVMPATAAGLTLSDSPASQQLTQQWMSLPLPGEKSVGVYVDDAGRPRSAVMLTRIDMSGLAQSEFIRGAKSGTSAHGLSSFHNVRTSLGGQMQCGALTSASATVCVFADSKVGGAIDVFGTTAGDATAVRMRQAVESGH